MFIGVALLTTQPWMVQKTICRQCFYFPKSKPSQLTCCLGRKSFCLLCCSKLEIWSWSVLFKPRHDSWMLMHRSLGLNTRVGFLLSRLLHVLSLSGIHQDNKVEEIQCRWEALRLVKQYNSTLDLVYCILNEITNDLLCVFTIISKFLH